MPPACFPGAVAQVRDLGVSLGGSETKFPWGNDPCNAQEPECAARRARRVRLTTWRQQGRPFASTHTTLLLVNMELLRRQGARFAGQARRQAALPVKVTQAYPARVHTSGRQVAQQRQQRDLIVAHAKKNYTSALLFE